MSHAVTSATDQGNDSIVVIGAGFVGVSTALWLQREGRKVVLIDKAEKDVRRIATALKPILANTLADHQSLAKGTKAERFIMPCDFAVLFKDRASYAKDPLPWDIRRDNGFTWTEIEGENLDSYDTVFAAEYSFLAALDGQGQITDPGSYLGSLVDHFTSSGGTLMREHVIRVTRFMQHHQTRDKHL